MPDRRTWRRCLGICWKRHYATVCFGLPWLFFLLWGWGVEPDLLVERVCPVVVAGLPPELDGFTVAVLSDLHWNDRRTRLLDRIAAGVNARDVDLVVLLGDYVNGHVRMNDPRCAAFAAWLSRLKARRGRYAVLGNYDMSAKTAPLVAALEQGGFTVLRDAAEEVRTPGGSLNLIGLDYRAGDWEEYAVQGRRLSRSDMVNLLLVHVPDAFPGQSAGIALTLAGHTHGGQLRLPFYGALLRYGRTGRRLIYGHVREPDGRQLIVTGGLGSGAVDFRFNMPPEILFVRLESAPAEARQRPAGGRD